MNKNISNIDIFEINSKENNSKYNNKNKSESILHLNKKDKTEISLENEEILNIENNINCKYLLFSLCNCCTKKRRNIYNIFINKSMNIISEKLDIVNIFRNMYLIENINNNSKYYLDIIQTKEFLE